MKDTIKILINSCKGILLSQNNIIERLKEELDNLNRFLKQVNLGQGTIKNIESIESDINKKEDLIIKIERMTNILFNRLVRFVEEVPPSDAKAKAKKIVYRIEELAYSLNHSLEEEGELHKFLEVSKEVEYWEMDNKKADSILNEISEKISRLKEYLEQLSDVSDEFYKLPYKKADRKIRDFHQGDSLVDHNSEYQYHKDCRTLINRFENDLKGLELPRLNRTIFSFKRPLILDAGCSAGLTTFDISRHYKFAKVIGLELNKSLLRKARRYFPKVDFREGDFYYLDSMFPKGYFDIIFMGNNLSLVMKSLRKKQLSEILERARNVIREKGYIVIYDSEGKSVIAQNIEDRLSYLDGKKERLFPDFFLELIDFRK